MNFTKEVPKWDNPGTEPPASMKTAGWQAEYKPPAAYFNWFWNRVSSCLTEIREKLKAHAEVKGITTAGTGAAYTAIVEEIPELVAGATFVVIPHVVSTTVTPTLNVNELGAKLLRRRLSDSNAATVPGSEASWLKAGKPVRVTYDGTYWVVDLAKPNANDIYGVIPIANGGTGAATAAEALAALGGLAIIDATGANNNMDAVLSGGSHCALYITDNQTQGTPYAGGVTTFYRSLILSFAVTTSYGVQLALSAGAPSIYIRAMNDKKIGEWAATN